jgi:hypothetical protein
MLFHQMQLVVCSFIARHWSHHPVPPRATTAPRTRPAPRDESGNARTDGTHRGAGPATPPAKANRADTPHYPEPVSSLS